ncbi:MAG: hypothetical protein WA162_06240 [Thermodesulfobacteriota bacterium]
MNAFDKNAELRFIEPSPDAYLSVISEFCSPECPRALLIRPCNAYALEIIDSASRLEGCPRFFRDPVDTPVKGLTLPPYNNISDIDAVIIAEDEEKSLSGLLMSYIDRPCRIIAPKSDAYFKNRGLFITTIPKSGTHMLLGLLSLFGYESGGEYVDEVAPGTWYHLGKGLGPHCDFKEFYTYLRFQPRGGILHPFFMTPAIFMYRHPLDVVVSEKHYVTNPYNNPWGHYYKNLSKSEMLTDLLAGNGINLNIRERILLFGFWLNLSNVVPLSFEEIVGDSGGGSTEEQIKTIWSLQLKLNVPGNPAFFAGKIYNVKSKTFRSGKVNSYRNEFTEEHMRIAENLPKDFLETFGYDIHSEAVNVIPKRAVEFRRRPVIVFEPDDTRFTPKFEESFCGYNIVSRGTAYYAVPHALGDMDAMTAVREHPSAVVSDRSLKEVKANTLKASASADSPYPQFHERYTAYNIISFKKVFYGIPQKLGEIDIKDVGNFSEGIVRGNSADEIKDGINRVLCGVTGEEQCESF